MLKALTGKRPVLAGAAISMALYMVAAHYVENRILLEAVRTFAMAAAVAVSVIFLRDSLKEIWEDHRPDSVGQLMIGIELSWAADAAIAFWTLLWRLSGQPNWMFNNDFFGFLVFLKILAAILHMTAPGSIDGVIPSRNKIALGLVFGMGALMFGALLVVEPFLGGLVERLKPFLVD